jgi:hypothetical protein
MAHARIINTFGIQWQNNGLLSYKNMIIAGDLNITISSDEVWGGSSQAGSLDGFFKDLFQSKNLIDIQPTKLVPTWRNGRTGNDAIAK